MDYKEYKRRFEEVANKKNYSKEYTNYLLAYTEKLIVKKLPIIFDSTHFSKLVGYKKQYIKRVANNTPFFYRTFKVAKKNNKGVKKFRIVKEPLPSLKEIQIWILNNILEKIETSIYAKAYKKNLSIKDNAEFHTQKEILLTVDIKDFFTSLSSSKVEKLFLDIGYSKLLANLFSKICTLEGSLPQGAPTSPYLSNILLKDFDKRIVEYCKINKLNYTRYSDDLTFSGESINKNELLHRLSLELSKEGLKINESKTLFMTASQRQIVTGLVVNEKLQVPKKKRREIRQAMFYIQKYGLQEHLLRINCKKSNYLEHLLGLVNFVLFINPDDEEYKQYNSLLHKWIEEKNTEKLKETINSILNQENEIFLDDFVLINRIYPKGIICLISAAAYYDLTDIIPQKIHIAIPKYQKALSKPDYPQTQPIIYEDYFFDIGVNDKISDFLIYDIEKTLCDIVFYKKDWGEQFVYEVFKNYFSNHTTDLNKIIEYSKKMGISNVVYNYLKPNLI
ncbi:retron St85 family RNA-directed DNA polymerase [Bernardetia sp. Wsw4-3y2]|uniref:retron St85 family RNA-directed DNA polymerase n=1 Tax=Bernardetia sp. Wsw4-3y2 TaxID=3127471 RepID=UPI0030CE4FB7